MGRVGAAVTGSVGRWHSATSDGVIRMTTATPKPVVADELIQEAKNSGFAGLEGQPAFLTAESAEPEIIIWKKDFQNRYETFGDVVEGDRVRIERPAVVFDGRVVQRGLVRKVRDRA